MNYELAKQLKDAGFPQIGYSQGYSGFFAPRNVYEPETEAYFPTLSELIEACGDDYFTLSNHSPKSEWWATSSENLISNFGDTKLYGNGSTPEEAVANLWLELNKK